MVVELSFQGKSRWYSNTTRTPSGGWGVFADCNCKITKVAFIYDASYVKLRE